MSDWENFARSREPSPEEVASRREEERLEGPRKSGDDPAARAEKKRRQDVLRRILQELLRQDRGLYIVFLEFLRVGDFSIEGGIPRAKPPWGFYSSYASRWRCSEATLRNWVKQALLRVAEIGREVAP